MRNRLTGERRGAAVAKGARPTPEPDAQVDSTQVEQVVRGSRTFGAMIASSLASVEPPITMPQWRVLVLAESEPQNVRSVAEDLGVHPSNATRLCDRLVRAGLLDRRQFEHDRRQVVLTLTGRGRKIVDRVFAHRRRTVEQIMAALPADQRAAVGEAIDAFVTAAERADHLQGQH
jgi:DNA-binding MarR family transcriptional regulator